MIGRSGFSGLLTGFFTATLVALGPIEVAAQSPSGFLLKQPKATVTFRGGFASPSEGSFVFDDIRDQLTIEEGDFASFLFGVDLGFRLTERLDLNIGLEHARRTRESQSRDFIGTDDLPILQETRLSRTPLTVGVRAYLNERGRAISQFAWVPNGWSPYLGAGIGVMRYSFTQTGEFVDFQTLDILFLELDSSGSSFTANFLGGVDIPLGPRFGVVAEAKYSWAKADMSPDFFDFDKIDLSGTQGTLGLLVRF